MVLRRRVLDILYFSDLNFNSFWSLLRNYENNNTVLGGKGFIIETCDQTFRKFQVLLQISKTPSIKYKNKIKT